MRGERDIENHRRERDAGRDEGRRLSHQDRNEDRYRHTERPRTSASEREPSATKQEPKLVTETIQHGARPPDVKPAALAADESATAREGEDDDAEAAMAALMGFGGFGSSKNKHVESNDTVGGSKVTQPRVFRQYMNR